MYNKLNEFFKLSDLVDKIANNEIAIEDQKEKIKTIHKYRNQLQGWILIILSLNISGDINKNIIDVYGEGAVKITNIDKKYMVMINNKWKYFKDKKFLKEYEDLFYLGSKNDSPRRFHYCSILSTFFLLTRYMLKEDSKNVNTLLDILCKLLNIDNENYLKENISKTKIINIIEGRFKKFILDFPYVNKKKTPLMINIVNILTVFLNFFIINKNNFGYLDFYYDFIDKKFLSNKFYIYFNNLKLKFKLKYQSRYESSNLTRTDEDLYKVNEQLCRINEVNMINDIFVDNISYLSTIDDSNINELENDVNYLFNYILENQMNCGRATEDILLQFKNGDVKYKLSYILIFNILYSTMVKDRNDDIEMNINLELCIFEKVRTNRKELSVTDNINARNHLEKIIFDKRIDLESLENIDSDFNTKLSTISLMNKFGRLYEKDYQNFNSTVRKNLSTGFKFTNDYLYQ